MSEKTPLEILNEIKDKVFVKDGKSTIGDFGLYRRLSIIGIELKEKEQQDEYVKTLESINLDLTIDNTRMSKVLELIKEKRVNVQALFYSTSCEDYNKHYTHYEDLTEKEYDTLKRYFYEKINEENKVV